jgi:hypothetical protein
MFENDDDDNNNNNNYYYYYYNYYYFYKTTTKLQYTIILMLWLDAGENYLSIALYKRRHAALNFTYLQIYA